MLEKQRQQDPGSNTVRNSHWDREELECVDTTDAAAAWRQLKIVCSVFLVGN